MQAKENRGTFWTLEPFNHHTPVCFFLFHASDWLVGWSRVVWRATVYEAPADGAETRSNFRSALRLVIYEITRRQKNASAAGWFSKSSLKINMLYCNHKRERQFAERQVLSPCSGGSEKWYKIGRSRLLGAHQAPTPLIVINKVASDNTRNCCRRFSSAACVCVECEQRLFKRGAK